MDVSMALTIAQTLFAALQCAEVRKLCSMHKYKSELDKLLNTVKTIKNSLQDANSKYQELTSEGKYWVENLKDAVYNADDLLDEFNTIANQPDATISQKVICFFSSKNQLKFAIDTSREIKKLREKLDSLAKDHDQFGFDDLYKPVKNREETFSYVHEKTIIGRDADKRAIMDLLFKDDLETNISFVTIVGIGGLGKTALTQLVYNDLRIKETFKKNMYWVCVSENFGVKDSLGKMLISSEVETKLEDLYLKVRKLIEGKQYLLVLDDVWSENCGKWDELKDFLILGGRGSKILVTSRSKKVATAIGNYPIHELQGLSNKDSWELFKKISLGQWPDKVHSDLAEIGQDIVKKCANVPLSIKVVASLLRGQNINTWRSFRCLDLAKMDEDEDDLMPTLMFSYFHLDTKVKCCFSFCSIFPEDFVIGKKMLISLWSAQGYLDRSAMGESMEVVGEKYISILVNRCFFQDIVEDSSGEIQSFKMHDLIHDLARKVVGKESLLLTSSTQDFKGKIRHLSINNIKYLSNWISSSYSSSETLRTCFNSDNYGEDLPGEINVDAIISNGRRLRVLDLHYCRITRTLPDSLGKLLHLRYLDLSGNEKLEMLPKSITKLYNLQTLRLVGCENLKALPDDTRKLVNLKILDIYGCWSLTHMPAGMGNLTSLHTLTMFVVCGDDELKKKDKKGKLVDLNALVKNLRCDLRVTQYARSDQIPNAVIEANRRKVAHLKSLKFTWKLMSTYEEGHQSLLDTVIPNNLDFTEIKLEEYEGTELPSWCSMIEIYLPRLVVVNLYMCEELLYLPSSLSQLCHLKYLTLHHLDNVEYIESVAPSRTAKFFPSLEKIYMVDMPELMGWWRDIRWAEKKEGGGCLVDGNEKAVFLPSFPHLRDLYISDCDSLAYFPLCPLLEELGVYNISKALATYMKEDVFQSSCSLLKKLSIDTSCVLQGVNCMSLNGIQNLEELREDFQRSAPSIRKLRIWNCSGLEKLGMELLTGLETLKLEKCNEDLEGVPWKSFQSLSSLTISDNTKMVNLPTGFQYLTSLRSLKLECCKNLKELGECVGSLTSLYKLDLHYCYKLKSLPEELRYSPPHTELRGNYNELSRYDGKDWPAVYVKLTSVFD